MNNKGGGHEEKGDSHDCWQGKEKGSVDQKRGEEDHQIVDRLHTQVSLQNGCANIAQRLIVDVKLHMIMIKEPTFYVLHKCITTNEFYELMDLFKW